MNQEYKGLRDLVGKRNLWFAFSAIIIAAGIISLFVRGLNVGIDFKGGYIIEYPTDKVVTSEEVGKIVDDLGIVHNPVQVLHGGKGFLLRTENKGTPEFAEQIQQLKNKFRVEFTNLKAPVVEFRNLGRQTSKDQLQKVLDTEFKGKNYKIATLEQKQSGASSKDRVYFDANATLAGLSSTKETADQEFKAIALKLYNSIGGAEPNAEVRFESVAPSFSGELFRRAAIALAVAVVLLLVFIWIRYELWFSVAGILAIFHDCMITIGFFSILQLEIDASFVAIILTVFGYSINDSVVIFDRIRENLRKDRSSPLDIVINRSLWETMMRSINTTATVLLAILAVIIFGGVSIRNFSVGMFIGLTFGAYSSIFIAAPLAYMLKTKFQKKEAISPAEALFAKRKAEKAEAKKGAPAQAKPAQAAKQDKKQQPAAATAPKKAQAPKAAPAAGEAGDSDDSAASKDSSGAGQQKKKPSKGKQRRR